MKVQLGRRKVASAGEVSAASSTSAENRRIALAARVLAVMAGLGLVASLVLGGLWWYAANGSGAKAAAARDEALGAARQIAVTLQSLDYHTVDDGLATWEASAAGPLLEEFTKNRQQYADAIRKVQTSSRARVVDIALSDLDVAAGKAKALAAVDVTTTQMVSGAPSLPVTKQVRIQLELVHLPEIGWKAEAAEAIPS